MKTGEQKTPRLQPNPENLERIAAKCDPLTALVLRGLIALIDHAPVLEVGTAEATALVKVGLGSMAGITAAPNVPKIGGAS